MAGTKSWLEDLERARIDIEARVVCLDGELQHELGSSDGEVIGQARGFARFQVLAFQQCREAAALLHRVRESAGPALSSQDAERLAGLLNLGHRLQTASGLGLVRLRDRLYETATTAIHWSTGRLQQALEVFAGETEEGDSVATRPMAVVLPPDDETGR